MESHPRFRSVPLGANDEARPPAYCPVLPQGLSPRKQGRESIGASTAGEGRAASLSLGGEGFLIQAAFTLACVVVFQTAVMAVWIRLREPGELSRVFRQWRVASLVGVSGMLGSAGWFTAMTLENAAYVRAVGQVELVFTFIASYFFFGERSTALEVGGTLLVVAGIVILLLG